MAETHFFFFFFYFSFGLHLLGRNSLSQPAVCVCEERRKHERGMKRASCMMRRREEWKKRRKGKERREMGAVRVPKEEKKENERWRIKGLGVTQGIREKK